MSDFGRFLRGALIVARALMGFILGVTLFVAALNGDFSWETLYGIYMEVWWVWQLVPFAWVPLEITWAIRNSDSPVTTGHHQSH